MDIITGMSQEYYDSIGKHMIQTWLEFWPDTYTLSVYTEDHIDINHKRINIINLDTMDAEYHKLQNEKMKLGDRIKRFAKKAWPIMKHLESDNGYLIWVDADVLTESIVTESWLLSLINNDNFSAHIGVPQGNYYSVETGFFIINRSSKYKNDFLNEYRRIYYNRDFTNLHKPFDGDIFGKVIRTLRTNKKFKYRELNPNPDTALSPFNKIFDGRMKHYKAKRKNIFKNEK